MSTETDDVITTMRKAIKKIKSLRQQLADSQKQTVMLRGSLLASANYIDALGGNSFDPRRTLAATEPKEQGK